MAANIIQSWSDQERPWTAENAKVFIRPAELRIHLWPHAALTTVCEPLTSDEFGKELEETGLAMHQLMHGKGIGLAANQVGITKRFFVMNMPDGSVEIICNPRVVRRSEYLQGGVEGCLSLPGVTGTVLRPEAIRLHYQTPLRHERERDLHKLHARCAQHEIEHLDGKTFISQLSRQQRRAAMSRWEKERVRLLQGNTKYVG